MKTKGENHPSTYTLIKLPPLSSSDEAFAIGVPGHAGQTVFVGLGHFGPQLPRLVNEEIRQRWWKSGGGEKSKGGGRQQEETLSKSGGWVNKKKGEGKGWAKRRGH